MTTALASERAPLAAYRCKACRYRREAQSCPLSCGRCGKLGSMALDESPAPASKPALELASRPPARVFPFQTRKIAVADSGPGDDDDEEEDDEETDDEEGEEETEDSDLSVGFIGMSNRPAQIPRIPTGIRSLDGVLGKGPARGRTILVGGMRGCGKSTLLTQAAIGLLARHEGLCLWITGEEELVDLEERAERLGAMEFLRSQRMPVVETHNWLRAEQYILERHEAGDEILAMVVDSISVMHDPRERGQPGSVRQMKFIAQAIERVARKLNICTFEICHLSKAGDFSGPSSVQHYVTALLMLERPWSDTDPRRWLTTNGKNRLGPSTRIGRFRMGEDDPGLVDLGLTKSIPRTALEQQSSEESAPEVPERTVREIVDRAVGPSRVARKGRR